MATKSPKAPENLPIDALRVRIDELDTEIAELWRERSRISASIGAQRLARGDTRLSLAREQEIIGKFTTELGEVGTKLALLLLESGRGKL